MRGQPAQAIQDLPRLRQRDQLAADQRQGGGDFGLLRQRLLGPLALGDIAHHDLDSGSALVA